MVRVAQREDALAREHHQLIRVGQHGSHLAVIRLLDACLHLVRRELGETALADGDPATAAEQLSRAVELHRGDDVQHRVLAEHRDEQVVVGSMHAVDAELHARNGGSFSSGGLAREYGFTDLDGSQPDCWRYIVEVQDARRPADPTGYR